MRDRETSVCEQCGDSYSVKPSVKHKRRFCSKPCYHKALTNVTGNEHPCWKGGYEPYYGEGWPQMRHMVRNRDCFRCRKCGMHEDECDTELHVHHIVPLREFDEPEEANTPNNLVTVCPSCHKEVEGDVEAGRALL